jgi:urea transport system permease protein
MMGIVPSIEMVLWVAIGGRGTLIGAALGAVLMNWAKSEFSTTYPEGWTYFLGGVFILVVVLLPNGLAGLVSKLKFSKTREVRSEAEHDGIEHPAV